MDIIQMGIIPVAPAAGGTQASIFECDVSSAWCGGISNRLIYGVKTRKTSSADCKIKKIRWTWDRASRTIARVQYEYAAVWTGTENSNTVLTLTSLVAQSTDWYDWSLDGDGGSKAYTRWNSDMLSGVNMTVKFYFEDDSESSVYSFTT
jgi:hypothetical protein